VVGRRLATRLDEQPSIRLCLPTGNTPAPAYLEFVAAGGRLDQAEVFLLDEFALPAGHPARCDVMLAGSLLDRLSAPPGTLHNLDVAVDNLEAECARYEALVAERPLDLTLLGLGGNGHVGLNEPGTMPSSLTRVVELAEETIRHAAAYGRGAAPKRGVTIGMKAILQSAEIWLLVTGSHKAEILRRALTGPVSPAVPASFLQEHPNTLVLADDAATALLDG
jgi:glucosamine-6-phosphate deaminase